MPIPTWLNINSVTAIFALAGGLLGYALREFQNRIKPFFQIYSINGECVAGWELLVIPDNIREQLGDSFYIKTLEKEERFTDVYKCWDRADDVKRFWPDVSLLLEKITETDEQPDLEEHLYELLNSTWFDQWFTRLISRSSIQFTPSSSDLPERISVLIDHENEENNGVIWFRSSFGTTSFGQQLNNPAMLQNFSVFIDNLKRLDSDNIKKSLLTFKRYMEKEYQIAVNVHNDLRKLIDSCSRWLFRIAFTNLSNNPVVITKKAEVTVVDKKTKTPYPLQCALAKIVFQKGETNIQHSNAPISVRGGQTIEFAFVTKLAQSAMELGDDIRNVFERGSGECQVLLHLQRPGLFKNRKVKSEVIPFSGITKPNNRIKSVQE